MATEIKPWFVPHPRIRTRKAKLTAQRFAREILRGCQPVPQEDIFVTLHTAAYAISKTTGRVQQHWIARWKLIRNHIAERNIGLVHSQLARFRSNDEDIFSDAMLALANSIERFDPWRGFKFSTYACNAIMRAIGRRTMLHAKRTAVINVSFDPVMERPATDSTGISAIELTEEVLDLRSAVSKLTDIERRVIASRFPSDGKNRKTFKQIGNVIGMSKERVRQIQNIAIRKLRELMVPVEIEIIAMDDDEWITNLGNYAENYADEEDDFADALDVCDIPVCASS